MQKFHNRVFVFDRRETEVFKVFIRSFFTIKQVSKSYFYATIGTEDAGLSISIFRILDYADKLEMKSFVD